MTTERLAKGGWANHEALPKGPGGRALCRRCSVEVPKGRSTFCSKACVHEWRLRTDPGYVRQQVFERDRGVCAACGHSTCEGRTWKRAQGTGHLWQADHIRPVVEGGGQCGLDNLRTLCTACHKAATKDLAGRRAQQRRSLEAQPLFQQGWPRGRDGARIKEQK